MVSISLVRELPDSYRDRGEDDAIPRISKTIPRNPSLNHGWHRVCFPVTRISPTRVLGGTGVESDPGVQGPGANRDHPDRRAGRRDPARAHPDGGPPVYARRGRDLVPPRRRSPPLFRRPERQAGEGAGPRGDALEQGPYVLLAGQGDPDLHQVPERLGQIQRRSPPKLESD